MIFYSLQGLGNSVLNFPVLASLRRRHPVRVVAFENGSADFFRAFHHDVVGLKSNAHLLRFAWRARAGEVFTCGPTWRREIAASLLSSAERKRWFRPPGRAFGAGPRMTAGVHDLENNLDLLAEGDGTELNLARILDLDQTVPTRRILGVHPTASVSVKFYPRAFWIDLLARLAPDYDEVHVFSGGRAEERAFCRDLHPRASEHHALNFAELVPRLSGLARFIGCDSALMHLAATLGTPTLGLWAYADYRRIHPYGDAAQIYVPRETVATRTYEPPTTRPAYLDRANSSVVERIVRGRAQASFQLPRRRGPPVDAFEY